MRVRLVVAGVAALVLAGCSSTSTTRASYTPDPAIVAAVRAAGTMTSEAYVAPVSSSHEIRYLITGSAVVASQISYGTLGGGISQITDRTLPWQKTVEASTSLIIASVNAQNAGESGSVSCEVWIDGRRVSKNTSEGAYVIAQCSGSNQ